MPLATIHLISLTPSTTIPTFVKTLRSTPLQPLVISKVIRWIITPSLIDVQPLLHPPTPYHLLVITLGPSPLPPPLPSLIAHHWTIQTGIPSRLTTSFANTNHELLHPPPNSIPKLTNALTAPHLGTTSQTLELTPTLHSWITSFSQTPSGQGAVSMLNLLSFRTDPGAHANYLHYGRAFASSIGSRRGGVAKLVGNIIPGPDAPGTAPGSAPGSQEENPAQSPSSSSAQWNEFALAHYPTITHFADMLASADYQAVNLKYRVPSLRDTCILCTSEGAVEAEMEAEAAERAPGGVEKGERGGTAKL